MRTTFLALAAAVAVAALPLRAEEMRLFTLGAGPVGGGYFAAASAICATIHGLYPGELRCSADPSPGSVYNAAALQAGDLDFAIVQSDTQLFALEGTGPFAGTTPDTQLRSVLSLYPEPLTLVVREDSGIATLGDLRGRSVNLGVRNSGTRTTVEALFAHLGLDATDFSAMRGLATAAAADELCAGRLDAMFVVVGHPNQIIERAVTECGAEIVPVAGREVRSFLEANPQFEAGVIPGGIYPGLRRDVPTLRVTATLMTRADMDPDVVLTVAAAIVRNLPELNRRARVLPAERWPGIGSDGLSAPLFDGVAAVLQAP
jgi:TRAP transporter TAXI family solute receptor